MFRSLLRFMRRPAQAGVAGGVMTAVAWNSVASASKSSGSETKRGAASLSTQALAHYFDHTLLACSVLIVGQPDATTGDIAALCVEAHEHGCYSVCVNSSMVPIARQMLDSLKSNVKVCAVVGFPLGAMDTRAKAYEARRALQCGADEIDMVLPVGQLKEGRDDIRGMQTVLRDIAAVVQVCEEEGGICKVILETGLLEGSEIDQAVMLAGMAGAHFVKTCTGFAKGSASVPIVRAMAEAAAQFPSHYRLRVKASGGIRDYDTAVAMIDAGASRLGASRTIEILEECQQRQTETSGEQGHSEG